MLSFSITYLCKLTCRLKSQWSQKLEWKCGLASKKFIFDKQKAMLLLLLIPYVFKAKTSGIDALQTANIDKDKVTDQSYLYGFVNFDSKQQYDKVLAASPHQIDGSSVYVKATGPRYYKSVLHIKRQSRGFAYVYFCSIAEQQKALEHPQHIIDDNTLKVRPKERVAEELTIYVGGLSPKTLSTDLPISTPSMTDWCNPVWSKTQKQGDPSSLDVLLSLLEKDSLRESLSKFGKIVSVTVKPGYGFVIFDTRQAVESAMAAHPYKIDSTFVS
uniref:RRM domain-containing protein n=1 Tax=Ditylenchus dipsaci TaxID=166011 RepID=A0A915D6B5_9BILA